MPSLLARPSCHSPGGSILRQTNALRNSMVRITISAKPPVPSKTIEQWKIELDAATKKFRKYLIDFAGMDDEEAIEFGEMKIAKAIAFIGVLRGHFRKAQQNKPSAILETYRVL